jgi:hypothetical protein
MDPINSEETKIPSDPPLEYEQTVASSFKTLKVTIASTGSESRHIGCNHQNWNDDKCQELRNREDS